MLGCLAYCGCCPAHSKNSFSGEPTSDLVDGKSTAAAAGGGEKTGVPLPDNGVFVALSNFVGDCGLGTEPTVDFATRDTVA
jgi:hypothetical protein